MRYERERDEVHRPLVARLRVAGLFFLHVPNESSMPVQRRAMLASMGLLTGAPDLLIFTHARHSPLGTALELKAPGGRATEAQLEVLAKLNAIGWAANVCVGLPAAVAWLRALGYNIPVIGGV